MHWIDPDSLPPVHGTVERFIANPKGELDGLVLRDGTLVHFPPHLGEAVAARIAAGEAIRVHGVRPRGAAVLAAVALIAADGSRILDEGPEGHEHRKPDKPKRAPMEASGVVRLSLFAPKGELRGALLDDGTVLRLGPKEAERVGLHLRPGAEIAVRGEGFATRHGRVLEIEALAARGESPRPVGKAKHEHRGPHGEPRRPTA